MSDDSTDDSGNDSDDDLDALLYDACIGGDVESVHTLLAHGASNDTANRQGATALHAATWNGHLAVMRLLIEARAGVDATNERGCTCLHIAAQAGLAACARCLLEHGADVQHRCALGTNPLHVALQNGHDEVASVLWAAGSTREYSACHAECEERLDASSPPEPSCRQADEPALPTGLPEGFAAQAREMALPVRRLIVHGQDPSLVSAAAVVHAIRLPISQFRTTVAALAPPAEDIMLRRAAVLRAEACAALRAAVDAAAATAPDSVDGLADHQLDLRSLAELEALIGADGLAALQGLPIEFGSSERRAATLFDSKRDAEALLGSAQGAASNRLRVSQMFVRRCASILASYDPLPIAQHPIPGPTAGTAAIHALGSPSTVTRVP